MVETGGSRGRVVMVPGAGVGAVSVGRGAVVVGVVVEGEVVVDCGVVGSGAPLTYLPLKGLNLTGSLGRGQGVGGVSTSAFVMNRFQI